MKTKKGFLNLEGGNHSIVTPGNKLDVTAGSKDLCQKSSVSFEMYQPPYIVCVQINLKRGLMVVVFVVMT
jgi:hypothetical protein